MFCSVRLWWWSEDGVLVWKFMNTTTGSVCLCAVPNRAAFLSLNVGQFCVRCHFWSVTIVVQPAHRWLNFIVQLNCVFPRTRNSAKCSDRGIIAGPTHTHEHIQRQRIALDCMYIGNGEQQQLRCWQPRCTCVVFCCTHTLPSLCCWSKNEKKKKIPFIGIEPMRRRLC